MSLAIHLMGRPRIERDGVRVRPPKGRKPWALLAYLLGRRGPVPRRELAALLFSDAGDPLAALRWNLVELRRLLGDPHALRGDPLELRLPPDTSVDVRTLESGSWADIGDAAGLDGQLLEGMDFPTSAAFDIWLLNERQRIATAARAALREAVRALLAVGRAAHAIEAATRLVLLDPLIEEHQALLIRSYASAGDHAAASRQLRACIELFRREVGAAPGPLVRSAVQARPATAPAPGRRPAGSPTARVQLEAGQAALAAGMLESGLECLYEAVSSARACGDDGLRARALFAAGSALAHAGRHRRSAAAAALHEAIALGEQADRRVSAAAHRELAWLDVMAARYGRAERLLHRATALAGADTREQAGVLMILGMCSTDLGRYAESIERLEASIAYARASGNDRQLAYSLTWLGRTRLLRGELSAARAALQRAMYVCRAQGWLWLLALPESYLGEVELLDDNLDAAHEALEHALAMACRVGDLCFETLATRASSLLQARTGAPDRALARLERAWTDALAHPDYAWSTAYVLDALCSTAVAHRAEAAARWAGELQSLGERTGMREFIARAHLHRSRLGDPAALDAAQLAATGIDNPRLRGELGRRG